MDRHRFRVKALGMDRNYNRYWYFPAYDGKVFVEKGFRNHMARVKELSRAQKLRERLHRQARREQKAREKEQREKERLERAAPSATTTAATTTTSTTTEEVQGNGISSSMEIEEGQEKSLNGSAVNLSSEIDVDDHSSKAGSDVEGEVEGDGGESVGAMSEKEDDGVSSTSSIDGLEKSEDEDEEDEDINDDDEEIEPQPEHTWGYFCTPHEVRN